MGIIDSTYQQWRAWKAATALGSEIEQDRRTAMRTLLSLGRVSLPALHAMSRRSLATRAQLSAAVVLHHLGDPRGLDLLTEALRWQLPTDPTTLHHIEDAFVELGAPDNVDLLMAVWRQMVIDPQRREKQVFICICRAWIRIGDPRPIELLSEYISIDPELVEEMLPHFGEDALPSILILTASSAPTIRCLAARMLGKIKSDVSRATLSRLLRDETPTVRAQAAQSLDRLRFHDDDQEHANAVYQEILAALNEGYSSAPGIQVLLRHTQNATGTKPYEAFLLLLMRWFSSPHRESRDTVDAVLAFLPHLSGWSVPNIAERIHLHTQLCTILEADPPADVRVLTEVANLLAVRGQCDVFTDQRIRAALMRLLIHHDASLRQATAQALATQGDPVGRYLQQLLIAHWPQETWRDKLHVLLRGESDVSSVASEAMQWFNKKSRETMERLSAPTSYYPPTDRFPDRRLGNLLHQLLSSTLPLLKNPHGVLEQAVLEQQPAQRDEIQNDGIQNDGKHQADTSFPTSSTTPARQGTDQEPLLFPTGSVKAVPHGQQELLTQLCIASIRALVRQDPDEARKAHSILLSCLQFHTPARRRTGGEPIANVVEAHRLGEALRLVAGEAIRILYQEKSFPIFLSMLYHPTVAVRCTAIEFLGEIADVRAMPHLHTIAQHKMPVISALAEEAILRIRELHPETVTLLRPSQALAHSGETLLRPASSASTESNSKELLRPTSTDKKPN